jgi:membrane dipeptidase
MVIDGHNDLLLRLWSGEEPRHLDLERARAAGFAGGFFAIFVPGAHAEHLHPPSIPFRMPLPEPLEREAARETALALAEVLVRLEDEGALAVARRVEDFGPDRVNAILHLEGAEPLAPDLSDLDEWYGRGLRSVGLTWSRANAFAEGVPFAFPGSPDTGPGLTDAGRALVRACNERGILVDCSHLNRRGFFDVAELSEAPLVATHSNAWTLCRASRNLEDDQLDAIRDSGGVAGINFAVTFLREDGSLVADTPLEDVCRHADYLAERMGVDHVAFGSDFEGAEVPEAIGDATGYGRILDALRDRGWGAGDLDKLSHGNWLRVLRETWGS